MNSSKKSTCVFDLDGTLANVDHRRPLVTGKRRDYEAFHALLSLDPVNDWCKRLMTTMWSFGYDVVIVSARPKRYETETRQWLSKNEINYNILYLLRENGSDVPDQEIKVAWLKEYGIDNILFWVDDRAKVVKPLREAGVTVLHCAEGAY